MPVNSKGEETGLRGLYSDDRFSARREDHRQRLIAAARAIDWEPTMTRIRALSARDPAFAGFSQRWTLEGKPEAVQRVAMAAWDSARSLNCQWVDDAIEPYWATECGEAFTFIEGGPIENGMRFCCYCGGKITTPNSQAHRSSEASPVQRDVGRQLEE